MIYVGNTRYKMYVGNTTRRFQVTEPECFYIYHTSSGVIEKKYIKDYPTIDFTTISNVDGNGYGGVFTDYGGKGSIATTLAGGQYSSEGITNIVDDGTPYIGESNDSESVKMFVADNAITENTTAYIPQVGAIYYLKENPDYVLRRSQIYHYKRTTKVLSDYYVFSAFDSLLYNSIKLYFKEESLSDFEELNPTVEKTLNYKVGTTTTTYDAHKLFRGYGCKIGTGWITYIDILNKLESGKNYIYYYEATTLDGITIHSPYKVKLTINELTATGTSAVNYPFDEI